LIDITYKLKLIFIEKIQKVGFKNKKLEIVKKLYVVNHHGCKN